MELHQEENILQLELKKQSVLKLTLLNVDDGLNNEAIL